MKVLFCCDSPSRFTPDKDTTRALIEAGWQRGHTVDWVDKSRLAWMQGCVMACSAPLTPATTAQATGWYTTRGAQWQAVEAYDSVIVRSDPPVDLAYQRMCQLLALLPAGRVWNAPAALLTHNEKISALRFSGWMVDTIVSNDAELHAQLLDKEQKGVAKSLDSLGGEGVAAYGGAFGSLQQAHTRVAQFGPHADSGAMTMGQRWIDRVYEGDKRVILIQGQFAGAIVRVPQAGEFRGNIHLGGQVQATALTGREEAIVADVGPWLVREGILLAGLDLVGEYLTEINITSPTGFREIERLSDWRPGARFWEALEEQGQRNT